MKRKAFALAGFASGALAGTAAYRHWFGGRRERLDVYFDDGSFVTFGRRLARGCPAAAAGPPGRRGSAKVMNDAELREAIVSAAYLEGDFVLRSGKRSRYYLDKFRFETRPDILAALGDRIAGGRPRARAGGRCASPRRCSAPCRSPPRHRWPAGCRS